MNFDKKHMVHSACGACADNMSAQIAQQVNVADCTIVYMQNSQSMSAQIAQQVNVADCTVVYMQNSQSL